MQGLGQPELMTGVNCLGNVTQVHQLPSLETELSAQGKQRLSPCMQKPASSASCLHQLLHVPSASGLRSQKYRIHE